MVKRKHQRKIKKLFFIKKEILFSYSGQRMLAEAQEKFNESEKRRDENATKMEKTMKKMIEVKSGIEHLADKLHHLKGVGFKTSNTFLEGLKVSIGTGRENLDRTLVEVHYFLI